MAYKPTSKTQTFQATRITVHSPKPYDDVLNSLYSSIGSPDAADAWPKTAKKITEYTDEAREAFIKRIKGTVGPHDFMLFQVATSHLISTPPQQAHILTKNRYSTTASGSLSSAKATD